LCVTREKDTDKSGEVKFHMFFLDVEESVSYLLQKIVLAEVRCLLRLFVPLITAKTNINELNLKIIALGAVYTFTNPCTIPRTISCTIYIRTK
jgi:hypothetical protein